MTELGASSDSHTQELRIALFGPQVTHWTHEQLSELQSDLLRNTGFSFLTTTLLRLRSFHSTLEGYAWIPNHISEAGLDDLKGFAAGDHIPNSQNLSQTVLAPLTILSQIVNLVGPNENDKENDGCFKYQAAQGFCIGFLSAAALASSNNRAELEQNASNAVRLAFYVGAIIDAENLSHAPADRAVAVSARWKTHSDRTYLETSLDSFPNVSFLESPYIPCSEWIDQAASAKYLEVGLRILYNGRSNPYRHVARWRSTRLLCSTQPGQHQNFDRWSPWMLPPFETYPCC